MFPSHIVSREWIGKRRAVIEELAWRDVSADEMHELLYGDDEPSLGRSAYLGTDRLGRPVDEIPLLSDAESV